MILDCFQQKKNLQEFLHKKSCNFLQVSMSSLEKKRRSNFLRTDRLRWRICKAKKKIFADFLALIAVVHCAKCFSSITLSCSVKVNLKLSLATTNSSMLSLCVKFYRKFACLLCDRNTLEFLCYLIRDNMKVL